MEKISKPLNQWNDAELRAEFSKTYFKPLIEKYFITITTATTRVINNILH